MTLNWDTVVAQALALHGTEPASHYGRPTVKANGHPLVSPGHEPGSFVLHIDADTKQMLMATEPETYWQTPHYDGWPAVLVRYDTHDPGRVLAMLARSRDWAISRKPPRRRKAGPRRDVALRRD